MRAEPIAHPTLPAPMSNTTTLTNEAPTRARLEQLSADTDGTLVFDGCDFDGVDLARLNLQDARFINCQLADASLYAAKLSRTSWQRCRAGRADFESADLVDAHFASCDLNNTKWRRAKLGSGSFRSCKLTGAAFEDIGALGLVFEDSLLVGADLRRMSFRKARLVGLDFSGADLVACDFREATFDGGSLRDALLTDARFDGADLRGADIGGLKLLNAKLFKGATISHRQAAELMLELGLRVG
jgi:fluoroquinolone resistance protein